MIGERQKKKKLDSKKSPSDNIRRTPQTNRRFPFLIKISKREIHSLIFFKYNQNLKNVKFKKTKE